jgi:plastocyanin
MRFTWVVLAAGAAALGACGGGDNAANTASTTSGAAATSTAATPANSTATAAPGAAAAATSAGTPLPITGKTYEVKMIGDDKGYRFEPASLTIKVGDGIKFVNVTGGPHNLAFNTEPDASKAQLDANMPAQTGAGPSAKLGPLSGPLLVTPNDTYTVSFAGVKPGVYDFNCTPHLALGMKGQVTVQ